MRGVVASPCIGVCQLRANSELCEGCLRSRDEIGEWSAATNERRAEILEAVAARRLEEGRSRKPSS